MQNNEKKYIQPLKKIIIFFIKLFCYTLFSILIIYYFLIIIHRNNYKKCNFLLNFIKKLKFIKNKCLTLRKQVILILISILFDIKNFNN